MPSPPIRYVSRRELQQRFNEGGFLERAARGELREVIDANAHPTAPLGGEPFCTHSQSVVYISANGIEVAQAHRYVRPDGSIGLSGRPDPKGLLDRGIWYALGAFG